MGAYLFPPSPTRNLLSAADAIAALVRKNGVVFVDRVKELAMVLYWNSVTNSSAYDESIELFTYNFVHLTQQFGAGKTALMKNLGPQWEAARMAGPDSLLCVELARLQPLDENVDAAMLGLSAEACEAAQEAAALDKAWAMLQSTAGARTVLVNCLPTAAATLEQTLELLAGAFGVEAPNPLMLSLPGRLRAVLGPARTKGPVIIAFDEIDGLVVKKEAPAFVGEATAMIESARKQDRPTPLERAMARESPESLAAALQTLKKLRMRSRQSGLRPFFARTA